MAQLILNLDEDVILWIVSSAAREQVPVSRWVKNRLGSSGPVQRGRIRIPAPAVDCDSWDAMEPDPLAEGFSDPD